MAFKSITIAGSSTDAIITTNDETVESVVNSLIAYNKDADEQTFTIKLGDDVILEEKIAAAGSYKLTEKINIPLSSELKATTGANLTVTVGYYAQTIDVNAALTSVQQAVVDSNTSATNAATSETNANTSATDAEESKDLAQAILDGVNVSPEWVSGTNYDKYSVVTDPTDYGTYKAKVALTDSTVEPHSSADDWASLNISAAGLFSETEIVATEGQTEFTVEYEVGAIEVYRNGFKLLTTDYVADNATSVTLVESAVEDDVIVIVCYEVAELANTYSKSVMDTKLTEVNPYNYVAKDAAYTALAKDWIFADTITVGVFNITLPATPVIGDTVVIQDVKASFDTAPVTVLRNGSTIMGVEDDMTLDIVNETTVFKYTGSDWRI